MTAHDDNFRAEDERAEDEMTSESSDSDNNSDVSDSESSNSESSDSQNEESESALNTDEEDDEVVKAIIRSKELHRTHPPMISMDDFVVDVCFHPKQDLIALGSITGDVHVYKYSNEENELKSTIEVHLKSCRDIEFSEDGKTMLSAGKDKAVILTDVETEKLVRFYENAHKSSIYTLTVIGENTFATGDDDGMVKLWDKRQSTDSPIFSLKEMEEYVTAMITNEEKKYLVCASGDGSLTTLNMVARKLHLQSEEYEAELTSLGLFKRGTKILATSSKGKMYVFNWGEFGLHSDELPSPAKKSIQCMIPITDNIAITGDENGILRATSLFPNRHLGIVGQHDFAVENLDVCNDGTIVASTSHANDVKFWNVKYFENIDVSAPVKGGKQKQMKHNLPSSETGNASDFFSDL